VADTFAYMATFSNAARWDPGVRSAEQLDPGPVGAGTRFRLVVPFLGRRMSLTYRVTEFRPDAEVVLEASNRLIRSTDRISVAPDADGARVGYHADVRLRGPLSLLDPLLGRGFRAAADRATAGLARTLSAEPAPHA
jgi:carbon monoxide dehydrogenase subunit G